LLLVLWTAPVDSLITATSAPETTAPDGSVIVPAIEELSDCAGARTGDKKIAPRSKIAAPPEMHACRRHLSIGGWIVPETVLGIQERNLRNRKAAMNLNMANIFLGVESIAQRKRANCRQET
jgi:hypothetical protein